MKTSQIALLLVVVVGLIFGVTFASMYVSQSRNKKDQDGKKKRDVDESLSLVIDVRDLPKNFGDHIQRIATEYGKKGHADFWFANNHDEEIRVGLLRKNCECADVKLFVIPESRRNLPSLLSVSRFGLAGIDPLGAVISNACAETVCDKLKDQIEEFHDLVKTAKEGVLIPGQAVGFVRFSWEARRRAGGGPRIWDNLRTELWMQNPKNGPAVMLQAAAVYVDSIFIDTAEITVGTMASNDTRTYTILCWSHTRDDFRMDVLSSAAPHIQCGPPEPLTEEDREKIREGGPIRSGYRYTVTIRERTPDGKLFDAGLFTHYLQFKPRESVNLVSPLEVSVHGRVRGDVTLAGTEQGIILQPFQVRDGTSSRVTLQSQRKDVDLKVDRCPEFLSARLTAPKDEGGQRTWELHVDIGPNKISGAFPRNENESLRDSAIYLKIEGADRRLRIPVSGRALQ